MYVYEVEAHMCNYVFVHANMIVVELVIATS